MNVFVYEQAYVYEQVYGEEEFSYDVKHFFHTEKDLISLICFIHEKAKEYFDLHYKKHWHSEENYIQRALDDSFNPLKVEEQFDGQIRIRLVDALKMDLEKDFCTLEQFLQRERVNI